MCITRLDVSTCKDESYLFCFSMLKVSCFSKSNRAFVAWKLFKKSVKECEEIVRYQ